MPKLQPITASRHSTLRWTRTRDFRFAAQDNAVPLVLTELASVAVELPIAFVPAGDAFVPVVLVGLEPGRNFCVAADGRWLSPCLPALLRAHPFALAQAGEGRHALCIDEEVGLAAAGAPGEPFFTEEGAPTERLVRIRERLLRNLAGRQAARQIGELLAVHKLIEPWPLKIKSGDEERVVGGLHRIDEKALNALPAEAFEALRSGGALPMIYSQLLSMQNLRKLASYARQGAPVVSADPAEAIGEVVAQQASIADGTDAASDLERLERGEALGDTKGSESS